MRNALPIPAQVGLIFDRFTQVRPRTRRPGRAVHLDDYDPTLQRRLLALFETESVQALMDACHVIRVLEAMGCRDLVAPLDAPHGVLLLNLRRADGRAARVAIARSAWTLGQLTLARLLQPQLGTAPVAPGPVARPAVQAALPDNTDNTDNADDADDADDSGELTLSGDCAQIPLPDLLHMLVRGARSGVLRLSLEGGPFGECWIDAGELTHATCHGYQGEEALMELLGTHGTTFAFTRERPARRTIFRKAAAVILDTVRRLDERDR